MVIGMIDTVKKYIDDNKLIEKKDKIVIGVSGGADSVCLFFVLLELKNRYDLNFVVVHVNHGIRGKEADQDADYVEKLCKENHVVYKLIKSQVSEIAKREKISEEEAGRMVRYKAFREIANQYDCNKIAVAHNKNDQCETVLFHLFRGSGIKGMAGMASACDGIVRPLLNTSRQEIEDYLRERNIMYQTDKSNFKEEYTRNKIRLRVLPYVVKEINEKAEHHIVKTAGMLGEIDEYIEKNAISSFYRIVKKESGQYSFDIKIFKQEDIVIKRLILKRIIESLAGRSKDIEWEHIQMLLDLVEKKVGKVIHLPYGLEGVREYERISIGKRKEREKSQTEGLLADTHIIKERKRLFYPIEIPGEYQLNEMEKWIYFEKVAAQDKKNCVIPKNDYTKWFDYDKMKNTVFLRNRQEGDFLQIDSAGNTKKLKKYFIDQKVPKEKRDFIPLLADGSHIVWVIGGRVSEGYKVEINTKNILIVSIKGIIRSFVSPSESFTNIG